MHTLRQFHRYFLEESAFARDLVFLLLLPAECERCTGDEGGRQRALDFAWDCWRQALPARLRRKADCCGRIATVSLKHQAALRGKTLRTRSLEKRPYLRQVRERHGYIGQVLGRGVVHDAEELRRAERPVAEEDRVIELAKQSGWRRCQHCRNVIELVYGCNHMTCRCGHADGVRYQGTRWNGAHRFFRASGRPLLLQPTNRFWHRPCRCSRRFVFSVDLGCCSRSVEGLLALHVVAHVMLQGCTFVFMLCGCRTPASLWHARDWQMGSLLYLCFVLFQPVEGRQPSPSTSPWLRPRARRSTSLLWLRFLLFQPVESR